MALKLKGDTQSLQAVATGTQGYQTYNDIKGATCRLADSREKVRKE